MLHCPESGRLHAIEFVLHRAGQGIPFLRIIRLIFPICAVFEIVQPGSILPWCSSLSYAAALPNVHDHWRALWRACFLAIMPVFTRTVCASPEHMCLPSMCYDGLQSLLYLSTLQRRHAGND